MLRELAEQLQAAKAKEHAVEKLVAQVREAHGVKDADEVIECINDPDLKSTALAAAIKRTTGFTIAAERIRDWRRTHVVEG